MLCRKVRLQHSAWHASQWCVRNGISSMVTGLRKVLQGPCPRVSSELILFLHFARFGRQASNQQGEP